MLRAHSHPVGFGRYYDTPGCDDINRGCELRVDEALARDVFSANFTVAADLRFPLTLHIHQCEVVRAGDGFPTVFFTFYSPTGGSSISPTRDRIYNYIWVPVLLLLYCGTVAAFADDHDADTVDAGRRRLRRKLGPDEGSHQRRHVNALEA